MEERRQFNIQLSKLKGDYEGLRSRFDDYKKVWEDTYVAQDSIAWSLHHVTATAKEQKQQLGELGVQLASANEELVRLRPQVATVSSVRDCAFRYDYEVGMLRLKTNLMANPRTNLSKLDLKQFEPNEVSCWFVDTLERKEMPDTFPCPVPPE
ncbi:uncharacterized protein LOC121242100 isoform X2 [Juglans microcarpa x Juglans regia]|uniref:uncharacterized protein LOC121242100 isoform X2 n=1 Tax=Juglans microcarpa x Juglans regia TaxID=2249226 RepID=UPI001B7F3982|nr:uncharacterized protein LOC121242100 isoform X2 [Juglans microcarpa x Juglans regia]